jgi:hypothetical protein
MASSGRIYQRGDIYYVAYRWDGREYRESARSSDRAALVHESELTRNDPNPEALQRPMLYDTGRPRSVI